MSGGGVSGYAAIHAKVRAMYSNLLSVSEMIALADSPDFPALIAALKRTGYGSYLNQVKDKDLTVQHALFQIKRRLADAFNSVIQMTPGAARPLLVQLFRYYEIGNLKAVLRGIVTGAEWDRIEAVLYPLGERTVFTPQGMLESGNVAAAVELLRGTSYYETLSFAMRRYNAEQSLFPIEVALDLAYWRGLWQESVQLAGQDREQALRVVGSLVDMNNVMWAIRYRVFHHVSEEELINYTLPFGYHIRDEDIRAIAAGAEIAPIVRRLYPSISDVDVMLEDPRSGLPLLELKLKRHVMERCMAAFVGNPFHVGVALAYLVLHDLEIQDLVVLMEAKTSQLADEQFRPYMIREIPV